MSQTSIVVYSKMGLLKLPLVVLLCSVFSLLSFIALCDASELTVKFLETPAAFSNLNSTKFVFEVLVGGSGACTNCNVTCKLDDGFGRINASQCENGTVLCEGLQDGNHKFEVCPNGTQGVGCSSYDWTVDTVPPTANITASTDFTNALNVSINISFSEPCTGGGFVCSSVKCNLLVYGAGQVIPTSLKMLQPNLQYSVLVGLSSTAQSGQVILVMDKNFCTDSAGNKFERNKNSNFTLHFDRRSVNFTTHVPERRLQFNGRTILVRATNNYEELRLCLTFPKPVNNTSEEIKNSLKSEILYSHQKSQGSLYLVDTKKYGGPRRFEYKVVAYTFDMIVVNVSVDTTSIISRQGTPFSPVEPLTFIYDSRRPVVNLSTQPTEFLRPAVMLHTPWTRERNILVLIEFVKPVFGFDSSNILITGGQLQRQVISVIKADQDIVSVNVPGSVSGDVAGNKNRPSSVLQVMHYSVPKISTVFSGSTTGSFVVIVIAAGLLKGIACHLQVIALSGWLAVRLPVEYYELIRSLRWTIPYLSLPWERETGRTRLPANTHTSKIHYSGMFLHEQPEDPYSNSRGLSRSAAYVAEIIKLLVEIPKPNSTLGPRASGNGWSDFRKNVIWLAIIVGSFITVHALFLILKLKNKNSKKQSDKGVLTFSKFEMVIVNLALPCICQASAAIIRGGTASGIAVGVLLLVVVSFLLLALLLFLYKGITCKQLLEYEEDDEGDLHWYEKIGRAFLVFVKKPEWTSIDQQKSNYLTILGSLYEDYRGPPKSKLSQISGGSSHTQAEAPFIQKLFGKLRIYYTLLESVIQKLCGELRIYYPLLESVRRVLLAIMAGLYEHNSFSKIPTIFSLCINCFHLFFLVLEKPFIKKNIQLLEIMAVSSEACISAIMCVLGEKKLSDKDGKKFGILMIILVLVGILPQIMNELYDLYKQIKQLDSEKHSFLTGLKTALSGLTSLFSSKEFPLRRPPALKDNTADSNSKPTSVADEDKATSTSTCTSYQVKSPNQD
uniref:Bacterial Ig-like domain-containing protein n=1 Tax=Quercus lobata TaxID=97700 RepID=A0A7N2MNV3_QUELO